jgi:hypothetical protein
MCWASTEYRVIAEEIYQGTTQNTNVDQESREYGVKTIKSRSGEELAKVFVCHDHKEELAKGLAKMRNSFKMVGMISLRDTYYGHLRTNEWMDPKYVPDPVITQCIDQLYDMYDLTQLQAGTFLLDWYGEMKKKVLDAACNYVLSDALKYAYTGLTGIACIPWADFRFDLGIDMGAHGGKNACSGINVLDAMAIARGALTKEQAESGMHSGATSGTVPSVQGIPSIEFGVPRAWPLLRIDIRGQGGANEYY